MDTENCKNCQFSYESNLKNFYICRRFPPFNVDPQDEDRHLHPVVNSDTWCGEWKPKTLAK